MPAKPARQTARRPGRPPVLSAEQLLDVARDVFLARGIRATAEEVAARAGVSEGTVYNRFKSKDALFRAAMRFDPEAVPALFESIAGRVGEPDLRATLVDIGTRLLDLGRVALPVMMMSWSNPAGEFALEKVHARKSVGYRRALGALRDFFEGEARLGRLAGADPELLARVFMGSLHHYCLSELFELPPSGSPSAFVRGVVDLLLGPPRDEPAPPPRARSSKRRRPNQARP